MFEKLKGKVIDRIEVDDSNFSPEQIIIYFSDNSRLSVTGWAQWADDYGIHVDYYNELNSQDNEGI